MIYNAIIYTGNDKLGKDGFITYHKISNLNKFQIFIETKYPNWRFFNYYNHKTKEFIGCIKK
jgi:hypothetical protein